MRRARALDQLCRLLRAEPAPQPDWTAVLEVANRALITPRIAGRLDAADAPAGVRTIVEEVALRNMESNARLFSKMGETRLAATSPAPVRCSS